jgi:hypothetical protein
MDAICAGFKDAPKMCKRLLKDNDIEHDLGEGVIYFNDGYEKIHVLGIAVLYLLGILLFLCCYRRNAKR